MQDKPSFRTEAFPGLIPPLKSMSTEEFAALGAESVVFLRPINRTDLMKFVPEAQLAPEDAVFHLLMTAGGVPVLVSDDLTAIHDWLGDRNVTLVQRH